MIHERGCMSEPSDGKKRKLAHLAARPGSDGLDEVITA